MAKAAATATPETPAEDPVLAMMTKEAETLAAAMKVIAEKRAALDAEEQDLKHRQLANETWWAINSGDMAKAIRLTAPSIAAPAAPVATKPAAAKASSGTKKTRGKGVANELLELLKGGPMAKADIAAKFPNQETTVSTTLSRLKTNGKLTNDDGKWALA